MDLHTASVSDTHAVAATIAAHSRAGDLILLCGDLGVGKTAFAQGFGTAVGVDEAVTSPTFTLANRYEGRIRLNHLDVYRLEQMAEVLDLDLPELIDDDAVTLIEWGDVIATTLSNDYLVVRLSFDGDDPDARQIVLTPIGGRWHERWVVLVDALAPWAASC